VKRRRLMALAAFALAAALPAQEKPGTLQPGTRPSTRASIGFSYSPPGSNEIYFFQFVPLILGDIEIRCETAVVFLGERASPTESKPIGAETRRQEIAFLGRRVKEIYAEGHVHIRQREEVHDCHSLFLDFVHERGIIVDPQSRFPVPTPTGQPAKLHVKAAELRMISETQYQMLAAQVSTCPFGNPHYHLATDKLEIFRARAAQNPPPDQPPGEVPSFFYTATGNVLYVGSGTSFPVLWLPDFSGDSATPMGKTYRYVKDVRLGGSSEFGTQIGITIGDDLKNKEGKKWGSWLLDLDYLSKRGPGVGVDFAYEQPCYEGELKTYFQRDVGEDKLYGPPPDNDRWRVSWQHRWWMAREFQLDLEANLFSDRGYYPTYFEGEFKTDKPPENYAYIKKAFERSAVTGLFSVRGNDFETGTEYRPRLEYVLVTDPIVTVFDNPLYLTARAEFSRPRFLTDNALQVPSVDTVRADVDTLLEYPFLAGPVKVTPFAGIRSTYYEYDFARNLHNHRNGFTWGAEIAMQLSRDYGCRGGLLDLDGLRHVIEPSIEYQRTAGVDLHPEELFQYDNVDTFDDVEIVTFELRNLLQTVRHRPKRPASADEVLDVDLQIAYFPQADRDNRGDSWSNLCGDGIVRLSDELQFLAEFEWNPNDPDLEVLDTAIGWVPSDQLQLYAGYHHYSGNYDLVYGQGSWRASEKWLLRGYASYDFHRDDWSNTDLVVSRLGHDWVFSVVVVSSFGRDDFSFSIGLEPRFLFDPILRPRGLRREPEFQWLGTQVYK
jgi:hypothetical protein